MRLESPGFALAMLLVVASNVIYHLAQKTVPASADPVVSTLVSYATAGLLTLALLPLFARPHGLVAAVRELNASSVWVGVAIVGVEFGFLLAYRAGWNLGTASLVAGVALALLLVPLGTAFFGERWGPSQSLGVLFCLVGLVLLQRR